MNSISLITVYNNKELLIKMLASAKMQKNVDIDYVLIDNTSNRFSSAAKALNYGVEQAKGDVIVFLHQDIEFLQDNALETIYNFGMEHKNTVFGAAGVKAKKTDTVEFYSSMYEGEKKVQHKCCVVPTDCQTLDECLIACHKSCMETISFDEIVCNGWHLYGADLCLQAGLISSMNVMVIPMDFVWHKSNGKVDDSYLRTQNLLSKKYQGLYSVINTTNGYQYTNPIKRLLVNFYRKLRYIK